ncbi:hypothetical protein D9M68_990470 [compost metagenome]
MAWASAFASRIRLSPSATAETRPIRSASLASIGAAVKVISIALDRPSNFGRPHEPPSPETIPNWANVTQKVACGLAKRMSQ